MLSLKSEMRMSPDRTCLVTVNIQHWYGPYVYLQVTLVKAVYHVDLINSGTFMHMILQRCLSVLFECAFRYVSMLCAQL